MKRQVLVIGGGAAGLCCAGLAAQQGAQVSVLERNPRFGKKLQITGKGRCNLTNHCSVDELMKQVRTNPRFLYSAFHAFPPEAAMELFEGLGVPLKTERGRRVFPVSDQAADVVQALVAFAQRNGVSLLTNHRVAKLLVEQGQVCGVILTSGATLTADAVVVATGGLSYPLTGSDGDGYRLAEQVGHTIQPTRPSLVPVYTRERWCAQAMGLSLKNVRLTLKDQKGKTVFQELGEMLFTHFGVSGPLVLSASAYLRDAPESYQMYIDLKPGLDEQQLDARLLRDFSEAKNRDFANALGKLLPRKLIPVLVQQSEILPQTKVHEVTRQQRRSFVQLLKALPLTPVGFAPIEQAVITSGGVSVKEINPKTMGSKLAEGLYFAGEVIDVDAFTGGYNLQIAWSTAFLAAQAAASG
ncbi:MAG: NAD(P)/FAD-dependent oxidoreductase [Anaerotruncus sp.]|nr:NAD(P)/FAD-dependent oxidoreductase [Anaerotruncus sp.]